MYTHGHAQAVVAHHAKRTAKAFAPACLELLRPGDSILDVGCGPGSITRGFRDAVGSRVARVGCARIAPRTDRFLRAARQPDACSMYIDVTAVAKLC